MAETKPKKKKEKKGRTTVDETRFPKRLKIRRQMPKGPHGGMQLMLIHDVEHVGKQGEIVEVKPGYGRNYLIPQGLATFVTPEAMRRIEKHKAKMEALRLARVNDLKMVARKIEAASVSIEANAMEGGALYGSVGPADIAEALVKEGFELTEANITLDGILKELGLYEIPVALGEEVTASVKVWVVPSGETEEAE